MTPTCEGVVGPAASTFFAVFALRSTADCRPLAGRCGRPRLRSGRSARVREHQGSQALQARRVVHQRTADRLPEMAAVGAAGASRRGPLRRRLSSVEIAAGFARRGPAPCRVSAGVLSRCYDDRAALGRVGGRSGCGRERPLSWLRGRLTEMGSGQVAGGAGFRWGVGFPTWSGAVRSLPCDASGVTARGARPPP
jgi:hypothetical protein